MSKDIDSKIGSMIHNRINAAQLSKVRRQRALNAFYQADLFVEAFIRVAKTIEQVAERWFTKYGSRVSASSWVFAIPERRLTEPATAESVQRVASAPARDATRRRR